MTLSNKILLPLYMVFIWAISRIYKTYIVINFDVNPTAFSLYSVFFASLVLLIHGKTNSKMLNLAMREKYCWFFAILEILTHTLSVMLLFYTGSTRASYLIQLCTVFAIIQGVIRHNRKVKTYDIFSSFLLLSGVFYALSQTDKNELTIVIILTILFSLVMTFKTLSAELNPLNLSIMDTRSRMKITGIAVGLSSAFMAILIAVIKFITPHIKTNNEVINYITNSTPGYEDFIYLPTIISSLIFGIILISTGRYIYFKASKISSTETLLTIAALTPLATLIFELISVKIGIFDTTNISKYDVYICSLIAIGVVLQIMSKNKNIFMINNKKVQKVFAKK